jgi:hypothetical protein
LSRGQPFFICQRFKRSGKACPNNIQRLNDWRFHKPQLARAHPQ